MAFRRAFKVSRKTFFNPTGWLGYNEIKENNQTIWDTSKDLFKPATPHREEQFEAAVQRMKLSEADLKETYQDYQFFAYLFLALGIAAILFSFYVAFNLNIAGLFLGFAMSVLFLGQAFRYHFWAFQIKNRKLGCTFAEWKQAVFNKKASPQ